MLITKEQLQDVVDTMPKELDVAQLFDKILLRAKISEAMEQIKNGDFYTEEEIKKETDSWFED